MADRAGLVERSAPQRQQAVGQHDVLAHPRGPASDPAHRRRLVCAERALRHEGRAIAALVALDGGDAEQVVVDLHLADPGLRLGGQQVARHACGPVGLDARQEGRQGARLQLRIRIDGEKVLRADVCKGLV